VKPVIGITSHAIEGAALPESMGGIGRSSVSQQCIDALVAAGAAVVALPIGLDTLSLLSAYSVLDGLLLPGGNDLGPERYGQDPHPLLGDVDPRRDEMELVLARRAIEDDLPVLGICRGHQVLAVAGGGALEQHLDPDAGRLQHDMRRLNRDFLAHSVDIAAGSLLAAILGRAVTMVNSLHHQAVCAVSDAFQITALSADGVVEAVEVPAHRFAVGVQCHPESMWASTAPEFSRLFNAFIAAASDRKTLRASA